MSALPASHWDNQPDPMSESYASLDELLLLEEDWDYEGAPKISPIAVRSAQDLIRSVWLTIGRGAVESRPYDIAPLANGGVQIEWTRGSLHLQVEADPAGDLSFLMVQLDNLQPRYQNERPSTPQRVMQQIRRVLAA